ncbi:MAG: LPS export ABC transporter permease LptG [Desulfuromonas sp.]|uniref:LPS export ABC transporter permease LptG n=1 Tax=Desulfuromonas sp. TaxID=892 RepID=UPI000CB5AEE3|nr:LPS export ABC transporter permease LptG [Desulfuromonas sp.]PLX85082.1 MAG: LPS export ABC transporter permease LptG [Desulfuromonas sp.]
MTLLTRYILGHFRRFFILALGAFTGLYLLVDFFEKADDFIEHQAPLAAYFVYFANSIPVIVVQIVPLAVLLGVFLTLGGLSRTNELTAMRSGGVGLWRLTMPLLHVSLAISVVVLLSNEFLVPVCARQANHTLRVDVQGKPEISARRDRIWYREGNTIVNIRLAQPEQNALQGISLFEFDPQFHLQRRIDAPAASYSAGSWTFRNITERSIAPPPMGISGVDRYPLMTISLSKTPEDFRTPRPRTEEMGYRELAGQVHKLENEGFNPTRFRVDLQARLATPFANLIMAFLGIPFALHKGRGANLAVGIALSVGIGITYHIIQAMLLAFGYAAVVPPLVAAWSANLLFALIGVWLLLTARD